MFFGKDQTRVKSTIKWPTCQDIILINTAESTIEDSQSGIKTDGKLTFCRLSKKGQLIRIISSGCTLLEKSGKRLYLGKNRTIIYDNGKLKTTEYLIDRTGNKERFQP